MSKDEILEKVRPQGQEKNKIRLVSSEGEVLWEKVSSHVPNQKDLVKLLEGKKNQNTSFKMEGPIKDKRQTVWVYRQRESDS